MEIALTLKILVLLIGFYMAWNIGANDVSNAMGTSVGSGALTLRRAVLVAAVLEFSGAFLLGSNVSETMQTGLIEVSQFSGQPLLLVVGMCSALLGASIWLQIASYFGWPVSTTHAIVGAIIGFGALASGWGGIEWGMVGSIAASWVISPLLSGILAYLLFHVVQVQILFSMNPTERTRQLLPLFTGLLFGVFTLSFLFGGLSHLDLQLSILYSIGLALVVAILAALITFVLVQRTPLPPELATQELRNLPQQFISLQKAIKHLERVRTSSRGAPRDKLSTILSEMRTLSDEVKSRTSLSSKKASEFRNVEKMFGYLQILSACFVAFAHGANDVANAIGPVAAVLGILKEGVVAGAAEIPVWLLVFGGLGIVIGLATWGWRVIETIGKKITELTPTRGFSAEFAAATTILIASKLGLPISTTHCLVGAVLGVGMARGIKALNLGMLKDIVLSWIVTMPASALMGIIIFFGLKALFLHA